MIRDSQEGHIPARQEEGRAGENEGGREYPREKLKNRLYVLLRNCWTSSRVRGKPLKDSKQTRNVIRFAFQRDQPWLLGEKGLATHYNNVEGLDFRAWTKATAEGLTRRGWTWEMTGRKTPWAHITCLNVQGKDLEKESGTTFRLLAGATRWLRYHFSGNLVTQGREDEAGREGSFSVSLSVEIWI